MNIKQSQLVAIIKEVVRECIEERKDKWIKGAVKPSHKGYCTPMSKATCTPRRKALAQRFKKGDLSEEQFITEWNALIAEEKGDDKWIQKAVDPSHKGYCTPMTKDTCTPHRKALAMRFKKGDIHKDNMSEVAPPGFGPDKEHSDIYNKLMKQYKGNPEAAYATMWKIHNKIDEVLAEAGLTSEKADSEISPLEDIIKSVIKSGVKGKAAIIKKAKELYKQQISKHGADDDAVNDMMSSEFPEVNEASYKVVSPNETDTAEEDKARTIQTDPQVTEASYKTVSPNETDTAAEPKARAIQTEPKVTENHKVQHRSAKTVNDLDNDPQNVRDPEVPQA